MFHKLVFGKRPRKKSVFENVFVKYTKYGGSNTNTMYMVWNLIKYKYKYKYAVFVFVFANTNTYLTPARGGTQMSRWKTMADPHGGSECVTSCWLRICPHKFIYTIQCSTSTFHGTRPIPILRRFGQVTHTIPLWYQNFYPPAAWFYPSGMGG